MLKSLFGIVEDVAKIAAAPVKVAADITRTVTKPIADAAEAVADEVGAVTKDIQDELRDDHKPR